MHFSRFSAVAIAILAPALVASPTGAVAQDAETAGPKTLDELVDFIIRPTQPIDDEEDIWNWDKEPEPSALESPLGPPLAGPTATDPIGPPLAGPIPEPIDHSRLRPRRAFEREPFAATGIPVGRFVVRPAIEIGGTASDNPGGSTDKVGAVGFIFAPEIAVSSEGERYRFDADARGEIISYDREEFNERTAAARAKLRYDLSTLTSVNLDLGYARFLESFTDPNTPSAAAQRPGVDTFDATLGVERRFGRFSAKLSGFANHALHEDVDLAGGGVASRSELDNTDFGGRLRLGYATSASLRPFAEAAVGRRVFDQAHDDSGFARASVWGELRGGFVIDRGEKLSGEISLGYRHEDLEDSRLEDLNVLLANAAILWSPHRLTELRLDLSTEANPTSTPDVSASIVYAGTLTLSHSFTPRVRGEVGVGLSHEHEVGGDYRDLTFTGFAGATYAFNRVASVEARYTYQRTHQSGPDEDYDSHEVGVRFRVQR